MQGLRTGSYYMQIVENLKGRLFPIVKFAFTPMIYLESRYFIFNGDGQIYHSNHYIVSMGKSRMYHKT